jgi:hypothetical protein
LDPLQKKKKTYLTCKVLPIFEFSCLWKLK